MKFLVLSILLFFPLMTWAWTSSSRLETEEKTQIIRSILQFNKGSMSITYRPEKPPYGSVSIEKVFFKNRSPLFLTGWAQGAHTMIFKVFDPATHGNNPLCEVTTSSESSELRIQERVLQIKVYDADDSESKWVSCSSLSREIQSVPKKK